MTDLSTAALAAMVGGRLIGDGLRRIVGIGDFRTAGPDLVGFVRHPRHAPAARASRAGALLLATELETAAAQIVVGDVDVAYAKVATHFHPLPAAAAHSIHPTAVVHASAELESPVAIGPHAVIGRCRIGAGSVVMAGVSIGDDSRIGRHCVLYPHVVVYGGVTLGDRVIVHANAVIGSDGFGYARQGATWLKVPQLGGVIVEDDVELGAGTAIDRGTLGNTRIGARSKFDNLCHVAHNCNIGEDVVVAAGGMIAGSATIGDRCVFAGQVGVNGHITIAADVRLGGATVVLQDLSESGDYMGHPVMEKRQFMRTMVAMRDLPALREGHLRARKSE